MLRHGVLPSLGRSVRTHRQFTAQIPAECVEVGSNAAMMP
jgi:hypothetical protein